MYTVLKGTVTTIDDTDLLEVRNDLTDVEVYKVRTIVVMNVYCMLFLLCIHWVTLKILEKVLHLPIFVENDTVQNFRCKICLFVCKI